ncbi:unnamed protein product [Didymodactylos carnosus]|uniref:Uncharacterized protein n=1 Tax=Didymodactylos carnosus TaxID=1234261 RepID=A0A814MFW4_9BILA|nr:unnamed protein product [Didymodactylos carnosus]CAF3843696.1 unnamed protein product [Didymodactylos carnosus]
MTSDLSLTKCQWKKTCKKSGTLPCNNGCKQRYCREHIELHHRELDAHIQRVYSERDRLVQEMYFEMNTSTESNQAFDTIKKWEQEMMMVIKQVADKARFDVQTLIDKTKLSLKERFDHLTEDVRKESEKNVPIEYDIERLSKAVEQLKMDRHSNKVTPVTIQIQHRTVDFDGVFKMETVESEPILFDIHHVLTNNKSQRTKTVDIGHGTSMVASDNSLLYWQQTQLCLVDQTGSNKKILSWRHSYIEDLCWCSKLNQFFIWTRDGGYSFDDLTFAIVKIKQIPRASLIGHNCCTCVGNTLLLVINRNIELWRPSPKWVCEKKWVNIVEQKEIIRCIRLNENDIVAMTVGSTKIKYRFELRHLSSMIVTKYLELNVALFSTNIVLLPNDEWLLLVQQSESTTKLMVIDKQCQIRQQMDSNEHRVANVALINHRILIIRTKEPNQLHFHYLN